MRFANMRSWEIGISADKSLEEFALWLRDVEGIAVPPAPLVPGPYEADNLPAASGVPHEPGLGDEWLVWWLSLVDREPRRPLSPPDDRAEPAHDTPDPLGLARLPVLRGHVVRRWAEFLHWRTARHLAGGSFVHRRPPHGDGRTGDVVREVERALGRRARPFRLQFTLLPVRDDRILRVGPADYLVPVRVFLSDQWPAWLRPVVERVA